MKLYHGQYILPALAAFLTLATLPIWRGMAARQLGFQSPANPNHERCIESKEFMRAGHMKLLVRWRDEVVRNNDRVYVATDGRHWDKGLKTCVACHGHADTHGKSTTAAANCTECHNYVNAKLDCWNCHHDSAEPVAQVFNLPYRRLAVGESSVVQESADWKSAIQQTASLRYAEASAKEERQ